MVMYFNTILLMHILNGSFQSHPFLIWKGHLFSSKGTKRNQVGFVVEHEWDSHKGPLTQGVYGLERQIRDLFRTFHE